MNADDQKLADDLQREIDSFSRAGPDEGWTSEEQDWINTARLALGPLRAGQASVDERRAAQEVLERTPPRHP